MRNGAFTGACILALALTGLEASAQDREELASARTFDDEAAALFSDDDLADLVAPIALYPDSLLAQVLVAATFPLEVVKAERFIDDTADLSDADRADAAEAEDWDPSVVVLAAGFPTVVQRMAEELDWTEQLGDAMLLQTDDLLDAIQLMRARASAAGTLASNEAQVVEVVDDAISIAPADPQIIYVPTYDTQTVYAPAPTAYATAPTAYATTPVYTDVNDGFSTTNLLTTGAIAFGSAMLFDEIFDDDDDNNNNNYYDDYWRPGRQNFDWDEGGFNPRPGVNVDGDVNVNVDRNRVDIERGDRVNIDRGDRLKVNQRRRDRERLDADGKWKPSNDRKQEARDRLAERKDKMSPSTRPAKNKAQKDSKDRDAVQAKLKDRQNDKKKSNARDKLKEDSNNRKPKDPNGPQVVANRPGDNKPGGDRPQNLSKPADRDRAEVRPGQRDKPKTVDAAFKPNKKTPTDVDRAKARAAESAKNRTKAKDEVRVSASKDARPPGKKPVAEHSAFKPADKSAAKVRDAKQRGSASVSKERAKPKVQVQARPKAVSKPKQAKPHAKKSPQKSTAFKKPAGGGAKAKKSSSRGGKSAAKRKK